MIPASAAVNDLSRDRMDDASRRDWTMIRLFALHFFNDGFQAAQLWLLPFAATALGISVSRMGILASAHYLTGVGLAIPAALLAKRLGDEFVILVAMSLYSLAMVLFSMVDSEWSLWVSFALGGVGFGLFHPIAFAVVGDRAGMTNRAVTMGRFTAIGDIGRVAFSCVFIGGAALAGWRLSAGVGGGLALLAAIILLQRRSGQPPQTSQGGRCQTATAQAGAVCSDSVEYPELLRHNRRFLLVTTVGALDSLVTTGIAVFAPILLIARGIPDASLAWFAVLLFSGSLLGKVVAGWLADKVGGLFSIAACHVSLCVCICLLALNRGSMVLGSLVFLMGLLSKGSLPVILALTAESLPRRQNAVGFGVNQTLLGLASSVAPLVLGQVIELSGNLSGCIILSSVCLLTATVAGASHFLKITLMAISTQSLRTR